MAYNTLTLKENDMVTLLIEGVSIIEIAKKLNVTRQTIYNWAEKDIIKAELDRRKKELASQGNQLIIKDLTTYIDNIKAIANDKSDKRVCLAANQYLLNRIYGNPTGAIDGNGEDKEDNVAMSESELEQEIKKFKGLKAVK